MKSGDTDPAAADKNDSKGAGAGPKAEEKPAKPLETVPEGQPANATTAVIPGTGRPVQDGGKEHRVVTT